MQLIRQSVVVTVPVIQTMLVIVQVDIVQQTVRFQYVMEHMPITLQFVTIGMVLVLHQILVFATLIILDCNVKFQFVMELQQTVLLFVIH